MEKDKKNLVWKYFWKQKAKEIGIVILVLIGLYASSYAGFFIDKTFELSCQRTCAPHDIFCYTCSMTSIESYIGYSIVGLICLFILAAIIYGFYYWIKCNWDRAISRANEKIDNQELINRGIRR
jgi:hypothetical protein